MKEVKLDDRRGELRRHFEAYWERRLSDAGGTERFPAARVARWKALYERLLADDRFVYLAEPVTAETRFLANEYAMRYDGVHVFPEAILRDGEGRFVVNGNPMRFPWDEAVKPERPYLCDKTEEIFGVPVRTVTTVKSKEGKKDHGAQLEECENIIFNQRDSACPIEPLRYDRQISAAAFFAPEDFLVRFPVRTAMEHSYFRTKFEPVVKGIDWMIHEAHRKPYATFEKLSLDHFGATGSVSFGDEEDLVDFDVMFLGTRDELARLRDFLYEGTRAGDFRPFMSNYKRRLRVCNRQLTVDLTGEELLFCVFFGIDGEDDPMYGLKIEPLREVEAFEAQVADDGLNMICPTFLKLKNVCHVEGEDFTGGTGEMPMIILHGGSRGQFCANNWLRVKNVRLARITPLQGEPYEAIVSTGWFDVDLASW